MSQGTGGPRRLLLTGFEPFGGDAVNPSKEIVQALDGEVIGTWQVRGMVLPVTYGAAAAMVLQELGFDGGGCGEGPSGTWRRLNAGCFPYDVVLSLGQAKGRDKVCLERVAINVRDAGVADHAGHVAQDEPVLPGGPAAYFSTLPLRSMVAAIEKAGVPAAISNTAGTYVCNDLLYLLLHFTASGQLPIRVGFIHLPALPEQVSSGEGAGGPAEREGRTERPSTPSLPLSEMLKAVTAAIEAL